MAQAPELCVPSTHEAYEFAFTNDDKMMFSLGKNELKVWLTEGPFLLKTIPIVGTDSMDKIDLFVAPDNKKLILNLNGVIKKLNLQTLEMDKTVFKIAVPKYIGWSKNGKSLYYTVMDENTDEANIFKINVETGVIVKVFHLNKENAEHLGGDVSLSSDETLLVSGSALGGILLDLKSSKILRVFDSSKRVLFINDAGNVIVSNLTSKDDEVDKLEEIEPRTMKVVRSTNVTLKKSDIPEYDANITISHNNHDKVMYEYNRRFYIINLTNSTQSKRQEVKFENDGFKLHQAVLGGEMIVDTRGASSYQSGDAFLSAGGKFAFWPNFMTGFKIDNVKKIYPFGILSYQPFMLSDLSQGNELTVLAGDRITYFGLRDVTFKQLPKSPKANFTSSYRYLAIQNRLFMNGVPFKDDNDNPLPFVYDLKNDVSQFKQLDTPEKEAHGVYAMREYDSLNMIVMMGNDRFFTMDTRTLKIKTEVLYGNDYLFTKNRDYYLRQSNDNHACILSNDKTKLIISLGKEDDINVVACYSLVNKTLVWKYESSNLLSNTVYIEGGKKVRFFNDKNACITLDALTGKMLSSTALIPNASESSFFSPTQKYVLNVVEDKKSDVSDILNYEVYDVATKKLVISLPPQRMPYIGAIFMSNDRYLLTQDEDMKLWDLKTGKQAAHIITFHNSKDWILLTPDGRFDGSKEGLKQLYYLKGQEIIPLEQLYEGFYTPGLMKQVLDGEGSDGGQDIKKLKSPPSVKIGIPVAQRNLVVEDDSPAARRFKMTTDKISLTVEATCPDDGVSEIRLFHNGKIVGSGTRNLVVEDDLIEKFKTQTFDIQLVEGDNTFKAIALNTQRTESKPDEIIINFKAEKGSNTEGGIQLHVIVIGINKYKNPKYNLNYAIADATSFKEGIEKSSSTIFSKVNMAFINDENATKANIVGALEKVKTNASSKDVFIFYYAGHGVMNDKKGVLFSPPRCDSDIWRRRCPRAKRSSRKSIAKFFKRNKSSKTAIYFRCLPISGCIGSSGCSTWCRGRKSDCAAGTGYGNILANSFGQ